LVTFVKVFTEDEKRKLGKVGRTVNFKNGEKKQMDFSDFP